MIRTDREDFLQAVTKLPNATELHQQLYEKAYEAAKHRGCTLYLTSVADLVTINKRHQLVDPQARPLTSTVRAVGGTTDENTIVMIAEDAAGEVRGTRAIRWFDWRGTDLAQEATSLRLFYKNPERHRRPNESCEVRWPEGVAPVSGQILFGAAVYVSLGYRDSVSNKPGLSTIMSLAHRCAAFQLWPEVDTFATTLVQKLIDDGVARKLRFRGIYGNVFTMNDPRAAPNDSITLGLGTLSRQDVLEDAQWFIDEFPLK